MVASLLCHKRRIARQFIAQWASGIMCVALAPTKGQTPANLEVGPDSGRRQQREALPGGSVAGLVLED